MASRSDAEAAPKPRLRVGFILANRFTLTAFSTFVDALRLASDEGDRSRQIHCRWTVMSSTSAPVSASCGVEVLPLSGLADPRNFDYVVVVGGLLQPGPQVDEATLAYLRQAAAAGVTLVGVCTGSFILARARVLEGRRACVSWFHRQDFLDEFASVTPVVDRLYLIDGDRITSPGGAGVADLAAALIERRLGAEAARKSLRVLLIDRPRAENAPQPMPSLAREARDERVRRAILIMESHLSAPLSVARIAGEAGLGARQLARRFRGEMGISPAAVYRAMRLDYGRWLIAEDGRAIGDAAALSGFADGAHFTREFRKRFGAAPSAARNAGRL
jgi:transcriptional regulator GlxA family with amidase domain